MSFPKALALTLKYEGGYVNDPDDPGGATNRGVTQKVYTAYRDKQDLPYADVKGITEAEVADIYKAGYWDVAGCSQLPEPLDTLHFDAAVNHGPGRAAQFLKVAGGSPKKYLDAREAFYHQIVARRPASLKFLKGWLRRVADLRKFAGA